MRRVVPHPPANDPVVADAADFGRAIRVARTAAGMTLVDAAATLGIAKQTLSDLETGRASVGLATALRVAREMGVAVFAVAASEREPIRRIIIGAKTGQVRAHGRAAMVSSSPGGRQDSAGVPQDSAEA